MFTVHGEGVGYSPIWFSWKVLKDFWIKNDGKIFNYGVISEWLSLGQRQNELTEEIKEVECSMCSVNLSNPNNGYMVL